MKKKCTLAVIGMMALSTVVLAQGDPEDVLRDPYILAQGDPDEMSLPWVFEGIYNPRFTQGGNPSMNIVNDCAMMRASTTGNFRYFDDRIEPENPIVHDASLKFAGTNSGALTSNQIRSIYEYLRFGDYFTKGWIYKSDPKSPDYYAYANETLRVGEETGCTGTGDCDDFAIVMSALVESIGGTTRMVHAYNSVSGHAYSEVYIGTLNENGENVFAIIKDLMYAYGTEKVYAHIDETTRRVWLNLDWSANYPGGAFFNATNADIVWMGSMGSIYPSPSDSGEEARQLVNKGTDLSFEGKYYEALDAFDEAIKLQPSNAGAYYSRGTALCILGMTNAANIAYNKAAELDPFIYGDYHCP